MCVCVYVCLNNVIWSIILNIVFDYYYKTRSIKLYICINQNGTKGSNFNELPICDTRNFFNFICFPEGDRGGG